MIHMLPKILSNLNEIPQCGYEKCLKNLKHKTAEENKYSVLFEYASSKYLYALATNNKIQQLELTCFKRKNDIDFYFNVEETKFVADAKLILSISETLKIINKDIKEYGSPQPYCGCYSENLMDSIHNKMTDIQSQFEKRTTNEKKILITGFFSFSLHQIPDNIEILRHLYGVEPAIRIDIENKSFKEIIKKYEYKGYFEQYDIDGIVLLCNIDKPDYKIITLDRNGNSIPFLNL